MERIVKRKFLQNKFFKFMDIKKLKWHYLLNRKQTLLFRSLTHATHKYYKGMKGMSWQANYVLHFGEGDFFIIPEDFAKFRKLCSNEGLNFFYNFRKNLILKMKSLDELTAEIERLNPSIISDKKLLYYIEGYAKRALPAHWFLSPFPLSDKVLAEKILNLLPEADNLKKQEWLKILTFPEKENEHTKEGKAFYSLALFAQKQKNAKIIDKKIDRHLKKFSWIGGRYLWDESWTKDNLKERIDYFLQQKKDPMAEYEHLRDVRKDTRRAAAQLIKELRIKKTSELYKYIVLAREFSYLRTWRTDIIYRGFFRTKNIFCELARRVYMQEPNDIRFLTFEEAIETARKRKLTISPAQVLERKKFYVFVLFKDKADVLSGNIWKRKMNFLTRETGDKNLKGNIAFHGKASGYVKIVETGNDLVKVKNGDIMVAAMTFPHFIPAMEKAAAFITDEGGILCHAAIVAREMGKPCIIGTKNATKVLKDGDFVEVDAERGVVKILK